MTSRQMGHSFSLMAHSEHVTWCQQGWKTISFPFSRQITHFAFSDPTEDDEGIDEGIFDTEVDFEGAGGRTADGGGGDVNRNGSSLWEV